MLKKEMRLFNDKKYYLLGKRKEDNRKVWLEEGSWDCDWYWGLGYIEIFSYKYKDIDEHTHFDSLFKNIDNWNEYFSETTLTKEEMFELFEMMRLLYTSRHYSDMLHVGANITGRRKDLQDIYKNDTEYNRINKEVIPQLLNKVYELLS